jgi:hypothetical protein
MNISIEIVPGRWDGDTFIEPSLIIKALDGSFEDAKPPRCGRPAHQG